MRRCAILKSAVHAAESFHDLLLAVSRDFERLHHGLWPMGPDTAGSDLRADIVSQRTCALAALAPDDIAEPGLPLALCPRVHAVAECAGAAARAGDRPHLIFSIFEHSRKHLETGAAEMLGDVLHDDRIT